MPHQLPVYTLAQLEAQPPVRFPSFGRDDALRLGQIAVSVILEWNLSLAVDVHIGDELAFRAQLKESGEQNAQVILRKIAAVRRFGHSSLLARLRAEADPAFAAGLDEYVVLAGGSIPFFVDDEPVGTISSSGEPDVVDHEVVAEALNRYSLAVEGHA